MIIELVTFNAPPGADRARIVADAKGTVPRWAGNRDLLRKHFVRGLGEDEGTLGGVYLWPSVEAARKAHDAAWLESVKARTGGYPKIRYFDMFLLVDNEQGTVTEFAEDGRPRVLQTA